MFSQRNGSVWEFSSVSPELWFQMCLTDYEANREELMNANNKLVDKLKLKEKFKIK